MEYGYLTDPGKVRDRNEDSVIIVENRMNEVLLAVADGMGGHIGGEIASSIVISHIGKRFGETGTVGFKEDAISFIREIVSEANVLLYKYTQEHIESQGMGTTLVLSIITKDYLLIANIGDSAGYVIKNNKIHKVTTDHTLVGMLVKSGEISEQEAKEHPKKNILMKALGAMNTVEMDIIDVERNVEGVFLCSDGLTNMLDDEQILKVLNDKTTVSEQLKKLVTKANNRGGNDNISIAYLKEGVK